jgi:phosphatidylglycerol lysyltransferase
MSSLPARIKSIHWEGFGVHLSAFLTAVMGVINLTSSLQPALRTRLATLENILPLEVQHGSRFSASLAGFALLLLAGNLWRRKHAAWLVTLILLGVSIVSHLFKGLDYEEASFGLALIILLVLLRRSFHAASDRPSLKQGLKVLAAAFVFTLIYGVVGFLLLDEHFHRQFGLLDAVRQTAAMFALLEEPPLEPLSGFGRYFAVSIYGIGLVTVAFAFLMLLRPVLVRRPASSAERARAKAIVQQFGRTALARATLFEDKSYFFSAENVMIAYGARGHGAIVLGDPIGPPEHIPAAIQQFCAFCAHNDWQPAFISTLPDHLEAYRAAGLNTLCLGFEAIVPLQHFTLEGSENKNLRNGVSRMERANYHALIYTPPIDDALLHTLKAISDAWLTLQSGGEMHFSDGWFDPAYLRECPLIVLQSPEGRPVAFANLVGEYQNNELTLDLMRHFPESPNGTMDYLFAKMLLWARDQGYSTFSLGLSAIVGVGEKADDPRIEQALHTLAEYLSRFYNFKGLHNFKEKFHPQWEPRYLVYPGAAQLPLLLNTLLEVHSGGNYLWKYLWKK